MSIEALLSLLAFFFLLGLFLDIAGEQAQRTAKAADEFRALAEAQKCALEIDSVFANSLALPEATVANCFQKEKNLVGAKVNWEEASAIVLAQGFFLNSQGETIMLEVSSSAHYK